MDVTELAQKIAVKDVDIDSFVAMAIREESMRDEIIRLMLTHPNIMVYYHCYYVAAKASQERPDLFFSYWDEIAALLKHPNSYHRDFSLTILANLTAVDQNRLFLKVFDDYFEHINDPKFMTGECCIQNSSRIIRNLPELKDPILSLLLDIDRRCTYTEKQKELLKCSVLEILDEFYEESGETQGRDQFIQTAASSISPKTRKKARELVGKHTR